MSQKCKSFSHRFHQIAHKKLQIQFWVGGLI